MLTRDEPNDKPGLKCKLSYQSGPEASISGKEAGLPPLSIIKIAIDNFLQPSFKQVIKGLQYGVVQEEHLNRS